MKQWPELIALINHAAPNAFALRFKDELEISKTTRVDTGLERGVLEDPVRMLDDITKCEVCDAAYLRGVHVWLRTVVMGTFMEQLRAAKLILSVEGTRVVDREPVGKFMEDDGARLPRVAQSKDSILFEACRLDRNGNADRNDFIGYFCANDTSIVVDIEGLPCGAGVVEIEVGCRIAMYTTRP